MTPSSEAPSAYPVAASGLGEELQRADGPENNVHLNQWQLEATVRQGFSHRETARTLTSERRKRVNYAKRNVH